MDYDDNSHRIYVKSPSQVSRQEKAYFVLTCPLLSSADVVIKEILRIDQIRAKNRKAKEALDVSKATLELSIEVTNDDGSIIQLACKQCCKENLPFVVCHMSSFSFNDGEVSLPVEFNCNRSCHNAKKLYIRFIISDICNLVAQYCSKTQLIPFKGSATKKNKERFKFT